MGIRNYLLVALLAVMCITAFSGTVAAQEGGEIKAVDLIGAWVNDGAPDGEFTFTANDGKEYVGTFEDDILPLFTESDVWAEGTQACTTCHNGVSETSSHEMDMGSYEGIVEIGADSISNPDNPAILVEPGDWANSKLRSRLRNNRMPPSMPFDLTEANRNGPVITTESGGELEAVNLIGAWVNDGAPDGEFTFTGTDGEEYTGTFEGDILPLFTESDVWTEGSMACTSCHSAVSETSSHEMDMGSYEGIVEIGADSISNPDNPAILVEPGDWANSKLRSRLRNNRMPPSMPFDLTEANRNGPVVTAGELVEEETAEPTEEPMDETEAPDTSSPGFTAIFAAAGLLGAAFVISRRKH